MSYTHLSEDELTKLGALLSAGNTQTEVARLLGRPDSTISRERSRNPALTKTSYDARLAKRLRTERRIKANQRFRKVTNNKELQRYIVRKLKATWSPEQIAGRLKKKHTRSIVCHETIYQWIYQERPDLKKYLRCKKGRYRRRRGTKQREKRREEAKKRRIDTRPSVVEERARIGDWEGDTIVGEEKTKRIGTHVERMSGYGMGTKLEEATAMAMREATIKQFKKIPKKKRCTLTYDNGSENADYEWIEKALTVTTYFCYPYHSWERGCNENFNGLLREFFPKKSSFATITQKDVDRAIRLINNRPRKRLDYRTPREVFYQRY